LLGVDKSTISRELKRNYSKSGYWPKYAQKQAESRTKHRKYHRKLTDDLKEKINILLQKKWSPEQISARIKLEGEATVSYETIYKYIYENKKEGGKIYLNLRRSHRKRKRRFSDARKGGFYKNATSIEDRPSIVNKRKRIGDWERDTMFGDDKKKNLLVLVERKSRYTKMVKLDGKYPKSISSATLKLLKKLPCFSVTNDRGFEFADYQRVERKKKIDVYFCHPYSSHERGTNENKIGLLRQYFPKKVDLTPVTKKIIRTVELEINNRPLKCLDWRTPFEVIFGKKVALCT
jgi:IS30 family transposase